MENSDMYKYKIKKQFKILDFSGKKIYLEKGHLIVYLKFQIQWKNFSFC